MTLSNPAAARASETPPVQDLKVVFFGTAELASHSLRALAQARSLSIPAVVSQPDRPKGRDLKLQPTPVKRAALELGLPVHQPLKARDPAFLELLRRIAPDLIVVAAYGQILPQALLDIPKFGCLNVHTSILPKYRGAAPIQWAIYNGDPVTGVSIMRMEAGLDTGPVLACRTTPIAREDNGQTLHDRLAALGANLLIETIPGYVGGELQPVPQNHALATYARKIEKEDGLIQWSRTATQLENQVRAFTPWPGAHTFRTTAGKRSLLKIWRCEAFPLPAAEPGVVTRAEADGIWVGTGTGTLRILEIQREGGKRLSSAEFLSGCALAPGEKLG